MDVLVGVWMYASCRQGVCVWGVRVHNVRSTVLHPLYCRICVLFSDLVWGVWLGISVWAWVCARVWMCASGHQGVCVGGGAVRNERCMYSVRRWLGRCVGVGVCMYQYGHQGVVCVGRCDTQRGVYSVLYSVGYVYCKLT